MIPLFRADNLYQYREFYQVALEENCTLVMTNIIVLADDNPRHHHTNLDKSGAIGAAGQRTGGCRRCYNRIIELIRLREHLATDAEARQYLADNGRHTCLATDGAAAALQDRAEEEHRNDPGLGRVNDLQSMQGSADQLAAILEVDHNDDRRGTLSRPGRGAQHFAMRIDSLDRAIAAINATKDRVGPIEVVNTVGHGFASGFHLGATCARPVNAGFNAAHGDKRVGDFVSAIKDSLATDVRWVLYACSTAGASQSPYQLPAAANQLPVAAYLLKALHDNGKTEAEVWGHMGAGQAMRRPFWVRLRMEGGNVQALSLFDEFRRDIAENPANVNYNRRGFMGQLRRYFRDIGYTGRNGFASDSQAIWLIPHWPIDLENVEFEAEPVDPLLQSVTVEAPALEDGSYVLQQDGGNVGVDISVTLLRANGHNLQVMPSLDRQGQRATRAYWLSERVDAELSWNHTFPVRLPPRNPNADRYDLDLWLKLWSQDGEMIDQERLAVRIVREEVVNR